MTLTGAGPAVPGVARAGSTPADMGPVPRAGARAFVDLRRLDVALIAALVAASFLLRTLSPLSPGAVPHPLSDHPVTPASGLAFPTNRDACQDGVPTGAHGAPRRECGFVFDEVYFPVDAARDLQRVDYFDPEPPLAKLLMAPPIALFGFRSWTWRLSTAIAGSLLVGLVYMIAMRLRRDRFVALVAAGALGLDGLALVESRTGVIDIIAITLVALLYYAFLLHWQARTRRQWRATLYLTALVAGLAFGAKLTALAPTLVIAALVAVRLLEPHLLQSFPWLRRISGHGGGEAAMWRDAAGRRAWLHCAAALLLVGAVFSACFSRYLTYPHNQVYQFSGCDPATGLHTSSVEHDPVPVITLGPLHVPNPAGAIGNIYAVTRASLQYHRIECRTHPFSSDWYSWPLALHPVLFYADYTDFKTPAGSPQTAWITDLGNPAVWWLGLLAILFCAWSMTAGTPAPWRVAVGLLGTGGIVAMALLYRHGQAAGTVRVHLTAGFWVAALAVAAFGAAAILSAVLTRRFVPALIVAGYLAAWLMWVEGNSHRVLFFYHALGMLPLLALGFAYAVGALRRARLDTGARSHSLAPLAYTACALVAAAFVFFYPAWTGQPQTASDHGMRIWLTDCPAATPTPTHIDNACWQ